MIKYIDTSQCVLFLGSGFAAAATNILKKHPPMGDALRDDLADLLKDSSYKKYDLQVVSEAAALDSNINLYEELYNRFTITNVPGAQRSILASRWRRIYTTNYDDSVEFVSPSKPTFNYDQPLPKRLPDGALIHLHGVI